MDDVYSWDQALSQGLKLTVDHSTLGTIDLPGSPLRFDDNALSGGRPSHDAPPTLGQHNESIRAAGSTADPYVHARPRDRHRPADALWQPVGRVTPCVAN